MKRKKVITGSAVLLAVLGLAGAVMAYFGASDDTENTVEIPRDKIAVSENFPTPSDLQAQSKNYYTKEVGVENTGNVDCYVRVYVDFPDSVTASKAYFSADGTDYYRAVRDMTMAGDEPAADGDRVLHTQSFVNRLGQLDGDWVFVPDDDAREKLRGYFYYKRPVKPGETTPELFKSVMIMTGDVPETLDLTVYAESVDSMKITGGAKSAYDGYEAAWNSFLG